MSQHSLISWCDDTANFVRGCDKVSPGCANCYITRTPPFRMSGMKHGDPRVLSEGAFTLARRLNRKPWVCDECGVGYARIAPIHADFPSTCCGKSAFHRRRIFPLSLGDFWDPKIPVPVLARMLDTVRVCDQVRWLVLSKRVHLWRSRIEEVLAYQESVDDEAGTAGEFGFWLNAWSHGAAPDHVLIGTSVEDKQRADERIPHLLRIPAAGRFISFEPLLGHVAPYHLLGRGNAGVQWWIIGGESGPKARACNVEWIRSLVTQGKAAGVAVFVKQLGADAYTDHTCTCGRNTDRSWKGPAACFACAGRLALKHPKGGDPAEWPEDLRVRQWPEVLR